MKKKVILLSTMKSESHSVMSNSMTPWTVFCQASLSMEFSRQRGLPDPGVKLGSPTLQANSFTI